MNRLIVLLTVSLLISNDIFAQNNNVWKKTVYRTLKLTTTEDTTKHHLTDVTYDTSLIEIMADMIKAGKLTAYNAFDHNFSTKLSATQLKEMTGGKTDTTIVIDPVKNVERKMIVHHEFDPAAVNKYRLLEEWAFDPQSGKTTIQIQGIAPIREIYGDDGIFRGVQSMFWIRFADASALLARYNRAHPTKTFANLIWDDYFLSDVKPQEAQ